eukprot:403365930
MLNDTLESQSYAKDDLRQGQNRFENSNQDEVHSNNQTMFLGNNNATINVNDDGLISDEDKTPTELRFSDGDSIIQNQIRNMVLGKVDRGTSKRQQQNYSQNNHDPLDGILSPELDKKSYGKKKLGGQLRAKNNKTDLNYISKTDKKQYNNFSSGYDLETVIRDQDYRSIPNGFKNKLGVAFSTTEANLAMDAGLCGIYNMGNTCFLNTAIQCLSAVQPLTDFFLGDLHEQTINKTNPMGTSGEISIYFANLLKDIWRGKEEKIYPQKLLKKLNEFAPHQDAQEFLAYLLDCLHEDLNRADKFNNLKKQKEIDHKKKIQSLTLGKQETEQQENFAGYSEERQELIAYDAWKDHLFNNRSIIVDLFQGQLKSALKCLTCQHMSIKFDSFMYLSVPIPSGYKGRNPTLEECVEEFTREEILDGDDKWKCPKCKINQRASKKIDIWKLPSILIVHLKRFEFHEKRYGKINDYVDFPLHNLNLTPYVSKLQREKPIYDLFAVSNHEGYLGGGHYYAFTKHRQNQLWYSFDDDIVKRISDEKVTSAGAYILFYSKMTVDEFARQTLSEPGLWPHIVYEEKGKLNTINARKPQGKKGLSTNMFEVPSFKPSPIPNDYNKKANVKIGSGLGFSKVGNSMIHKNKNISNINNPIEEENNTIYVPKSSAKHQSSLNTFTTPNKNMISGLEQLSTFKESSKPLQSFRYNLNQSSIMQTNPYENNQNPLNSETVSQQSSLTHKRQTHNQSQISAFGANYMQSSQQKAGSMLMGNRNQNVVANQSDSKYTRKNDYIDSSNVSPLLTGKNNASSTKPIVINNNNNNYFINLYMRKDSNNIKY